MGHHRRGAAAAAAAVLLAVAFAVPCTHAIEGFEGHPIHEVDVGAVQLRKLAQAKPSAGPVVADNATCAPVEAALLGGFEGALERFSQSIRIPTVSNAKYGDTWNAVNVTNMLEFQDYVQEHYPELATNIDPAVKFELVGGGNLSMLITWEGSDPSLRPVIINCHYDVVPTDQTRAASTWDHGVYSGYIDREKDRIYGRGTADNKGQCIGNLEAATVLYKSGWTPKRTLLFLFNHDEESSGFRGNNVTVHETLLPRYPDGWEAVWDEGLGIIQNMRTGKVMATVAIAEKGQQFVNVVVNAVGGHSSSPPDDKSAMGDILGRLLSALSNASLPDQIPPYITSLVDSFAEVLPKEDMDNVRKEGDQLAQADALINLALGTTTIDELRNGTKSRAYQTWMRTKKSMTLLSAGTSENTLPQVATMTWNFRSLWPWVVEGNDTNPGMIKFFEDVLASMNDTQLGRPGGYNVSFQPTNRGYGFDPQLGTTTNTSNWALLKKTVQSVLWQDGQPLPVVANLMVGGTDSKLMQRYSKQGALRMMPYALTVLDAKRIHGDNEQLSISSWRSALCLSHELIKAYGEMP